MERLGYVDGQMVRQYHHLHDEEARRRMADLACAEAIGGYAA